MFTSRVFRFHFLQKVTFRVSKCIICDSFSFSCCGFSNVNYSKPRGKFFSPPTISCLFSCCGCWRRWTWKALMSLNQSFKKRWHSRARGIASFLHLKKLIGRFRQWSRSLPIEMPGKSWQWLRLLPGKACGEVLIMAKVVPEPTCQGGLNNGQDCSRAIQQGTSTMAKVAPRRGLWEGLGNCWGQSWVKVSKRSQRWPKLLLGRTIKEVLVMTKLTLGQGLQRGFNDGRNHS
jgi:hypothetical protein